MQVISTHRLEYLLHYPNHVYQLHNKICDDLSRMVLELPRNTPEHEVAYQAYTTTNEHMQKFLQARTEDCKALSKRIKNSE